MWPGKIRPEKFVDSYNVSKTIKLERKFGPVLLNPVIHLSTCRTKFLKAEEALKARRDQYAEERKELLQKWEEIEKEGEEMQNNFVGFNKFLITNLQKRRRAQDALQHNKNLVKQHDESIADLTKKIDTVQKAIKNFDEEIHRHNIYEKYLLQVLEISDREDQLKNAESIVERYEYFAEIAMDLLQKQEAAFEVLQNIRAEWCKCEETNGNVILGLHTQLVGLQGRFELATEKTHQLEGLIKKIREATQSSYKDLKITMEAVYNLYLLISKARHLPLKIAKEDFENQLIFISGNLKVYHNINEQMRNTLKKNAKKTNKK